jgi:methyl-accepting chemotaxis protein
MKLFNKFLVALLISSLIPLIVYSVFLLMTTGTVLKNVVNENNTHIAVNMASEANRFFMDIEKGLDIAREIEKSRVKVSDAQKTALLFAEMQKNSLYYAIYLLDENFKVTSGVSSYDYTANAGVDETIAVKARDFNKVNVGNIGYISSDKPYVDVIYPISTFPREYLYMKVKLKSLMARVDSHRKQIDSSTGKQVYIFDDSGAQTSLADKPLPPLDAKSMEYLRSKEHEKAFVENKMVTMVMKTRGPEWLLVYLEPTSEAYAEIYKMFISAMVLILLTAGAAFLIATGLAQGLVKPIQTLVSGIEVIAKKGDLDYKLPHVDTAELNQVTDAFNTMTGKLKEMQVVMKQGERLSTIGQMSNILGHEIRNPLAAMTNAIYLIRMELAKLANAKDLKVFKRIDIIENEINSTNKIINDMLDFSRTRPPVLFKQDMGEVIK